MINKFKSDLHFNIECIFDNEGKDFRNIIEDFFLLNIKDLNIIE